MNIFLVFEFMECDVLLKGYRFRAAFCISRTIVPALSGSPVLTDHPANPALQIIKKLDEYSA
jgi:hypothetical protein